MLVAVAVLVACSSPEEEVEEEEASPYEMPDYSYCTETVDDIDEDDGGIDSTQTWTWGRDQLPASWTYTWNDYLDEQWWRWDENDCLIEDHTYELDPEESERWTSYVYTCDDRGLPVSRTRVYRSVWYSSGSTSESTSTAEYAYEVVDGLPVLQVGVYTDDEGDVAVGRTAWSWEDGLLVSEDSYSHHSSTHEEWTYDDEGRELTWTADDEWSITEYDIHGRPVAWTLGDGAPDSENIEEVWAWTWRDDLYVPITVSRDFPAYGYGYLYTFDCTDSWPWGCDVTATSSDEDGGTWMYTDVWSCEEAG